MHLPTQRSPQGNDASMPGSQQPPSFANAAFAEATSQLQWPEVHGEPRGHGAPQDQALRAQNGTKLWVAADRGNRVCGCQAEGPSISTVTRHPAVQLWNE